MTVSCRSRFLDRLVFCLFNDALKLRGKLVTMLVILVICVVVTTVLLLILLR